MNNMTQIPDDLLYKTLEESEVNTHKIDCIELSWSNPVSGTFSIYLAINGFEYKVRINDTVLYDCLSDQDFELVSDHYEDYDNVICAALSKVILANSEEILDQTILEYDDCPEHVQDILDTYNEDNDGYKECARIVSELNKINWTASYYLDAIIYNFRPLKTLI